jgi:hypothetical protein
MDDKVNDKIKVIEAELNKTNKCYNCFLTIIINRFRTFLDIYKMSKKIFTRTL